MAHITVEEALDKAGDSLESALAQLWHLDENRLIAGLDYELDVQDRSESRSDDAARRPFFARFDKAAFQKPTYRSFGRLLDNYIAETGVVERVSSAERAEEDDFLNSVIETPVAKFGFHWLRANNPDFEPSTLGEFVEELHNMWFKLYRRDAARDSSAFEHVFCGEIDDGKVKGLHNYIQVFREERNERFDYHGYLAKRSRRHERDVDPDPRHQLLTIRFEWLGHLKTASSMFVGTSPEFELMLYTMMRVSGEESMKLDLGPYTAQVKVFVNRGNIGSAFPSQLAIDEDELEEQWAIEEKIAAERAAEPDSEVVDPEVEAEPEE